MSTWATSDWHLGHRLMDKLRGPGHERKILENYLRIVKPGDTVYFLGDMVLRYGMEGKMWWNAIADLPGRKILVRGNHDKGSLAKLQALGKFDQVWGEFYGITTSIGHKLLLSHVPMTVTHRDDRFNGWRRRVAEEFKRGDYVANLHGHTHTHSSDNSSCYNVCVEVTDYEPVLVDVV